MSIEFDQRAYSRMQDHPVEAPTAHAMHRVGDWFAAAAAVAITGAVLVNVFMFQTGGVRQATKGATSVSVEPKAKPSAPANPSMVFAPASVGASAPAAQPAPAPQKSAAVAVSPPPGVPVPPASLPTPRVPVPMVADIQRELARRGFYDGTADGLTGPKTEAAIRAFEQAAHLKTTTGEPTDAVLAQLRRAPAPAQVAAAPAVPVSPSAAAARAIMAPPANVPGDAGVTGSVRPPGTVQAAAPSTRLLSVQKSLARLGYGPIKLDGQPGTETRLAIQRFERDRNLPITGDLSDRMVQELATVSGTPIN